jgi:hypothetical protein
MNRYFRKNLVEVSGLRTIDGGGTNASNAGQALINLSGVSITGDQIISGTKIFRNTISYGMPSGLLDLGLNMNISSGSGSQISFTRGGLIPGPHGYGIVFDGGSIGDKKGYLTVGSAVVPVGYQYASLDWVRRILSGQWKSDQRLLVNGTGVLLSGEAVPPFVDINNIITNFNFNDSYNSKLLTINASQNITGTVPTGLPTGYNISFVQMGTGQLRITGVNSVTIRQRLNLYNTAGQYSIASLLHRGNNEYILYGDLV